MKTTKPETPDEHLWRLKDERACLVKKMDSQDASLNEDAFETFRKTIELYDRLIIADALREDFRKIVETRNLILDRYFSLSLVPRTGETPDFEGMEEAITFFDGLAIEVWKSIRRYEDYR